MVEARTPGPLPSGLDSGIVFGERLTAFETVVMTEVVSFSGIGVPATLRAALSFFTSSFLQSFAALASSEELAAIGF